MDVPFGCNRSSMLFPSGSVALLMELRIPVRGGLRTLTQTSRSVSGMLSIGFK